VEQQPNPPIACNMAALTAEQRERRAELVKRIHDAKPAVHELADGYLLRFEHQPGIEDVIRELMPLEENCCPFLLLEFTLLEPNVCEFRVRGPEGAKDVIVEGFDLARG
jgi:hypothetical protein